jgi:dihydroneopterin aldolase
MTDRIILSNIRVDGRHGVYDHEREHRQPVEVDVELVLDLAPAGAADDLDLTVDYGRVDTIVRDILGARSFLLLEAIAGAISGEVLDAFPTVEAVVVRVRKPAVQLGGPLDSAGVEIERSRD